MKKQPFHITLAVGPINILDKDGFWAETLSSKIQPLVQLVKPALLYADTVKLYSIDFDQIYAAMVDERTQALTDQATPSDLSALKDLITVIKSNALEPHLFSQNPSDHPDDVSWEFCDGLAKIIGDGTTFPLFDAKAAKFFSASSNNNSDATSLAKSLTHTSLANSVISRLPLFEKASISEIIDIRKELTHPLIRFRQAMIEYGATIKSHPWDTDFAREVEIVMIRDIEPALAEIDEKVRSNSFLGSLEGVWDKKLELAKNSALGLIVSQMHFLSDSIAHSLGVGLAGTAIAHSVYKEYKGKQKELENNRLFLVYKAQQELDKRINP